MTNPMQNSEPKSLTKVLREIAEPKFRECRTCKTEFELPPFVIAAKFVHVCPECSERQAEHDQEETLANAANMRAERWKALCPPDFRTTLPAKLPNPMKLDKVLGWQFQAKGLSLIGPTGRGKSRCAWQLMKREYDAGKSISALDSSFGYEYSKRFVTNAADVVKWMDRHCLVDLLLMDDVLKVKLTESVEQALFVIVNYRTEWQLPIIFTTQDTGETLIARTSEDRGAALVRRIGEYTFPISFA